MNTNNIKIVKSYYQNMLAKNFDAMAEYLHEEVHLISPLSEVRGRDNVVDAAKNLAAILENIVFNAKFSSDNQVMVAYDFMFAGAIGKLRSAGLIDFKDDKIIKINLFYDGRHFTKKKDEIFKK